MVTWKEIKDNDRARWRLELKAAVLKNIRIFFWHQGFMESVTPLAVRRMIVEKYLQPVPIKLHDPTGKAESFFLNTSPEIGLKKMLAAGWNKIFQLGPVFRDYENFGKRHNPEFLMLEWYRSPGGLKDIMIDMEKMMKFIIKKSGIKKITVNNKSVDFTAVWDKISMKELWKRFLNVNLDEYLTAASMVKLCRSFGYQMRAEENYENSFYQIFLNKIEPFLGVNKPMFVYDYPAPMSALCQLNPRDQRYAERAECYIAGLEVANAYGELTDVTEQKKRLRKNYDFRRKNNLVLAPLDADFDAAVEQIQSAGGVAVGVDRLVMLLTEAQDINEVIFESVSDQLERSK